MMRSSRLRLAVFAAVVLAFVSLGCFALPMYVIWPFRHQGANELALALATKQAGPWLSAICAVLCAGAGVFIWSRTTRWGVRIIAAVALLLAIGGCLLTRVNVYELMFKPVGTPQFEAADKCISIRMTWCLRCGCMASRELTRFERWATTM